MTVKFWTIMIQPERNTYSATRNDPGIVTEAYLRYYNCTDLVTTMHCTQCTLESGNRMVFHNLPYIAFEQKEYVKN